jgi:hypothetical protein
LTGKIKVLIDTAVNEAVSVLIAHELRLLAVQMESKEDHDFLMARAQELDPL